MEHEEPWVELTYDERATFGECYVCEAKHGEWCNGMVGIILHAEPAGHGVHLGRLQAAPKEKRVAYR